MIVVSVCVVLFFIAGLSRIKKTKLPAPRPDMIATTTILEGDILIENRTSGYAVTGTADWYLEKTWEPA